MGAIRDSTWSWRRCSPGSAAPGRATPVPGVRRGCPRARPRGQTRVAKLAEVSVPIVIRGARELDDPPTPYGRAGRVPVLQRPCAVAGVAALGAGAPPSRLARMVCYQLRGALWRARRVRRRRGGDGPRPTDPVPHRPGDAPGADPTPRVRLLPRRRDTHPGWSTVTALLHTRRLTRSHPDMSSQHRPACPCPHPCGPDPAPSTRLRGPGPEAGAVSIRTLPMPSNPALRQHAKERTRKAENRIADASRSSRARCSSSTSTCSGARRGSSSGWSTPLSGCSP